MRTFHHLTYKDRLKLEALVSSGASCAAISDYFSVHPSTIYRELKRGAYTRLDGGTWIYSTAYSADVAQQKYECFLRAKGSPLKIGNDHQLATYIEDRIIKHKYSPGAVLGDIQANRKQFKTTISKTTLYRYIDTGVFLSLNNSHLSSGKRKKQEKPIERPSLRNPLYQSIETRPYYIRCRDTFGHWEMDTVIGKRENDDCILVLTERKTRYEIIRKLESKSPQAVVKAIDRLHQEFESAFSKIFKSITCDNGVEFDDYKGIEKGNRTKVYYCHPYCSSERGSNENANKLIRRWIPKGVPIRPITTQYIYNIQNWLNSYPRHIHNYQNSSVLFGRELQTLGIFAFTT